MEILVAVGKCSDVKRDRQKAQGTGLKEKQVSFSLCALRGESSSFDGEMRVFRQPPILRKNQSVSLKGS